MLILLSAICIDNASLVVGLQDDLLAMYGERSWYCYMKNL